MSSFWQNHPWDVSMTTRPSPQFAFLLLLLFFLFLCCSCHAQQQYEDNKQLDCYATNDSSTLGYSCNGVRSCSSYLTFRSQTVYQSPVLIAYLLGADASNISRINGIVTDVSSVPEDQLLLVPLTCSCSGGYYQHNASYTAKSDDTYLVVANDTYQGLSTCQALQAQNPFDSHNLTAGLTLDVPLRCACPTAEQASSGVRYLLTYLVTWGDDVPTIADRFRADYQAVLHANNLSADKSTIYPFTTLLVPLETEPTKEEVAGTPAAPPPSQQPADAPSHDGSSSGKKWVFIGVGVGVGALALCLIWLLCCRRWRWRRRLPVPDLPVPKKAAESSAEYSELSEKRSGRPNSVSVQSIRSAIESLTVYEFQELEGATGAFGEDHRIMGSVYRGIINGDAAAIKRLKGGEVLNEINIMRQINHSNVIRLSGYCHHEGNTYLVYEFAENGSLGDWLHHNTKDKHNLSCLTWKQRVQIAHDVAHGLNYLHNYTNPPYVHHNLKSSNILLDGEFRGKVANFGLARPMEDWERPHHLTRHVVGTQGYMAPEYLNHGLVTPKLDVFAFGVVMLELLSGKEATFTREGEEKGDSLLLWASVGSVMSGEDARSKLMAFVDPCLQREYPIHLAYAMAELAVRCVAHHPESRPSMTQVLVSLSAVYNSTLDWDPSDSANSSSMIHGR